MRWGGRSAFSINSRNVEGARMHIMEGHQCSLPRSTKNQVLCPVDFVFSIKMFGISS